MSTEQFEVEPKNVSYRCCLEKKRPRKEFIMATVVDTLETKLTGGSFFNSMIKIE